jgi:hypothetical protein
MNAVASSSSSPGDWSASPDEATDAQLRLPLKEDA